MHLIATSTSPSQTVLMDGRKGKQSRDSQALRGKKKRHGIVQTNIGPISRLFIFWMDGLAFICSSDSLETTILESTTWSLFRYSSVAPHAQY